MSSKRMSDVTDAMPTEAELLQAELNMQRAIRHYLATLARTPAPDTIEGLPALFEYAFARERQLAGDEAHARRSHLRLIQNGH
jgi:hypothetical protein